MRVLLADDEPLARARLRRLLAEISGVELVGEAENGTRLLEQVQELEPDIVLLDIHMPGLDGLQTAQQLKRLPLPPAVVFITAYSEHALSAFDTAASGYLLKPVRKEQLADVLTQCLRPRRAQLEAAAENHNSPEAQLLLRLGQRQICVRAQDIICCLADQKLTRIIHSQGENLSEQSLQELEAMLGGSFLRVHRAALVAVANIQSLENNHLRLRGYKQTIPVSRRRLPSVRRHLRGQQ